MDSGCVRFSCHWVAHPRCSFCRRDRDYLSSHHRPSSRLSEDNWTAPVQPRIATGAGFLSDVAVRFTQQQTEISELGASRLSAVNVVLYEPQDPVNIAGCAR